MIRWTVISLFLGSLVAAVLFDRIDIAPAPDDEPAVMVEESPVLPHGPSDSEVWYCPVGSSIQDGFADHSVAVTNLGSEPMTAEVRTVTGAGLGPSLRVQVEANSTEVVSLSDLSAEVMAGAMVDLFEGHGLVSHQVETGLGSPAGPCHSSVAERWYFATGATSRDAHDYLVLLNPFENDVIFTATFQTTTRSRTPAALERAVVPAQSVLVIDVGEFVSREAIVATQIATVHGGRLAVERLQTFDGQLGPVGSALDLGVSRPAVEWTMPAGRLVDGGDNTVTVFNPSDTPAEVDLILDPANPTDRATYGLIPIELTVLPGRMATLDLAATLAPYQLPASYELGVTAISTNQVPVVVTRWQLNPAIDTSLIGAGGENADSAEEPSDEEPVEEVVPIVPDPLVDESLLPPVQPDADVGITSSIGISRLSTKWAIGWMPLLDAERSVIVVRSPEGGLIEIRQIVGGELLPPIRASVEPGGSTLVPLDPVAANASIIITAASPVAVTGLIVDPGVDTQLVAAVPFEAS